MESLEKRIREAALKHILNTHQISKEYRYDAEQLFHNEIELFVEGAKKMLTIMMEHVVEGEVTIPASASFKQVRYKLPKDTTLENGEKVNLIILKKR